MIPYTEGREQILLADGLHKETFTALMMLYRNTKVKVRSPDGDTDFFDIVTGVLQRDTLAPDMFIICRDYGLQTSIDLMKENGFALKNPRSRRYPAETTTDADYTDDIALLANTPTQAESLMHSWSRRLVAITSTEDMCLNQRRSISTLKLIDNFTYHDSCVLSTESCVNMRLAKACITIDRLSIIWKPDLSDKIKRDFFHAAVVLILLYRCTK